jgi:hypothetical protein
MKSWPDPDGNSEAEADFTEQVLGVGIPHPDLDDSESVERYISEGYAPTRDDGCILLVHSTE